MCWLRVTMCSVMVGLLGGGTLQAGSIVQHGDFFGATIRFLNVVEASGTDAVPLYGMPAATADNSLLFTPVGFDSVSNGAAGGSDITDVQLQTTIQATEPSGIGGIHIEETGDYTVVGPKDAFALAMVATPVYFWITEIDGQAATGPSGKGTLSFSPTGSFDLSDGARVGAFWDGDFMIDVASMMDPGRHATRVLLSIDNVLATANTNGTSAAIAKKGFSISVTTAPEPSGALLAILGVLGLLSVARRKIGRG